MGFVINFHQCFLMTLLRKIIIFKPTLQTTKKFFLTVYGQVQASIARTWVATDLQTQPRGYSRFIYNTGCCDGSILGEEFQVSTQHREQLLQLLNCRPSFKIMQFQEKCFELVLGNVSISCEGATFDHCVGPMSTQHREEFWQLKICNSGQES